MIRIENLMESYKLERLPQEVKGEIINITLILDKEYGKERDSDCDGGYVVIIETAHDFNYINNKLYIDLENDAVPEFVNIIECKDGQVFTNSLILCNNDFGISFIIPLEMTPENLKSYMID